MTDLATLAQSPDDLARYADPGQYVVQTCERAKAWLTECLARDDIEAIGETKAQAEAIRIYTIQKQLGKDSELAAAEVVRRAERGIGVAIRRGQDAGVYLTPGVTVRRPGDAGLDATRVPSEIFGHTTERVQTYALTDNVTEEQFDAALTEAKAEQNLSRANVVRKVKSVASTTATRAERLDTIRDLAETGHTSSQIARKVGLAEPTVRQIARDGAVTIPADVALGKGHRRMDHDRIVNETVAALEGLAMGLRLLDITQVDTTQAHHWATSLNDPVRALNRFHKQIKEMTP